MKRLLAKKSFETELRSHEITILLLRIHEARRLGSVSSSGRGIEQSMKLIYSSQIKQYWLHDSMKHNSRQ